MAAVDAHVASHLFENVIGNSGCLAHRKATRVLVTHQVHLLQEADHIIFLDQGRIVQMGTYSELHHQDTITDETDQENNANLEIEQENVFATKVCCIILTKKYARDHFLSLFLDQNGRTLGSR